MIYLLVNLIFSLTCLFGAMLEEKSSLGNSLFLVALFSMCSTPMLLKNPLYGKYLLYTLFLGYVFLAFGMFQYMDLFFEFRRTALISRNGLFTPGEQMTLLGVVCFMSGYLLVAKLTKAKISKFLIKNWKKNHLIIFGVMAWLIGAYITIDWSFSRSAGTGSIQALGGFAGVYNNLGQLMMLGELIIVYAYVMWKDKTIGLILLGIILSNIFIGFVLDSKELGFRALAIFMVAGLILKGKVNIKLLIVGLVVVSIGFSLFAQYRHFLSIRGLTQDKALSDISENIEKAYTGSGSIKEEFVEGINYLLHRLSLNGSTEMVISLKTLSGSPVEKRHGDTLTPIIYAFVPRFVLPDKPDSNIGRLINKEFQVSLAETTYISAGQLAEFYWNFGIPGVIFGMLFIGILFSFISNALDLSHYPSVTRLLMLLVTVYILILRFEGGFAQYYTIWMRIMMLILLIHMIVPKARNMRFSGR